MPLFIQNIFIYFIEFLSFYFLSLNFKKCRFKVTFSLCISSLLFSSIFSAIDILLHNPILPFFLQCICYILFFQINFHLKIQEAVHTYLFAFILNITLQFVSFIPTQLMHISLTNKNIQLLEISITFFLCMLLYFFVPLHNVYSYTLNTSIFTQLVLTNTSIVYITISNFAH